MSADTKKVTDGHPHAQNYVKEASQSQGLSPGHYKLNSSTNNERKIGKVAKSQLPPNPQSPFEKVAAAMAAGGLSSSERRRAQKRKIDNFRRGAAGKEIRVGNY